VVQFEDFTGASTGIRGEAENAITCDRGARNWSAWLSHIPLLERSGFIVAAIYPDEF
jgi:hypothetical protein